jgi:hypothetical protein
MQNSKKRESQKIVRGLIDGSMAIDRMKREIRMIVGMVLSFAKAELMNSPKKNRSILSFNNRDWEVEDNGNGNWVISCFVKSGRALELAYSSDGDVFFSEQTQAIWETLFQFVDLVRECYPSIEKRWQFLLKAAAAKKD